MTSLHLRNVGCCGESDSHLPNWEPRFKAQAGKNEKNEGTSCFGVKPGFRMKLCQVPNFSLVNGGLGPSKLRSRPQPIPWCEVQSGVRWKFTKDRHSYVLRIILV